ncbi:MAG: TrkA family potassium uptake protein [Candidatus Electrothrix sp. AW2]|mgnify:CR=1 FL=1|jgi:trk system potassium uptake protein TrkA|nr:TrkA family potassium uptake protein [Candidatus Electrothrix sp. AX1]MCI5116518.1 TrkA family potassium uptake protein [Candidatus Electrothrix gigas]MCI5134531.1 TrkA family potassium uptake protein [Candidatus Electrothrix gigas]MCI5179545.1 TrkA family potassium uptake protein [Candidatus Electrothrix gigas]MCI5183777.1 TrkA family potassium uptake protein [Candidatus Electrothrix gigas]
MKLQIGIIGLGKFGLQLGKTLVDLGHEVLGVETDAEKVKNAQHVLTQVYQVDAMNREALEQIRIQDFQHVLVSVGDSIAASVMISMFLKELGVPKVWVKAIHQDHEKLLHKIGVDEIVIPEFMAAKQIASRIAMPGFLDYLPFDESMAVKEFTIEEWEGKTLLELNLTNTFEIQVIAVRRNGNEKYQYIPKANEVFRKGDNFVAIGKVSQLDRVVP